MSADASSIFSFVSIRCCRFNVTEGETLPFFTLVLIGAAIYGFPVVLQPAGVGRAAEHDERLGRRRRPRRAPAHRRTRRASEQTLNDSSFLCGHVFVDTVRRFCYSFQMFVKKWDGLKSG